MQVDLSTRKLKTLAKRLETDLALTPQQRRKTLDALARGFGHDGYPALKAAIDAPPAADGTSGPDIATLPDRALVEELERRGHMALVYTDRDLTGLVDTERHPGWLADNRHRVEDILGERAEELISDLAQLDGVNPADPDVAHDPGAQIDPETDVQPYVSVEWHPAYEGGAFDFVGRFTLVPLDLIAAADWHVPSAFSYVSGVSPRHVMNYNPDEWVFANAQPWDEQPLLEAIAARVRQGHVQGEHPEWRLDVDAAAWRDDPELAREYIAGLIAQGFKTGRKPEWHLNCRALA